MITPIVRRHNSMNQPCGNPPTSRKVSTTHKDSHVHEDPMTPFREGPPGQPETWVRAQLPHPQDIFPARLDRRPPEQAKLRCTEIAHLCSASRRNPVSHFPDIWWTWHQSILEKSHSLENLTKRWEKRDFQLTLWRPATSQTLSRGAEGKVFKVPRHDCPHHHCLHPETPIWFTLTWAGATYKQNG